ncbi:MULTISPECIES: hypothetical protein [Streptomyces]|uniref:hypothetical protein n=1 Tax=Streptomyces TaxID=1883 RepID=UPI00345C07FA
MSDSEKLPDSEDKPLEFKKEQAIVRYPDETTKEFPFKVYSKTALRGFPGSGHGTDSNISLEEGREKFGTVIHNLGAEKYPSLDYDLLFKALPDLSKGDATPSVPTRGAKLKWDLEQAHRYEHASWEEESLAFKFSKGKVNLELYCTTWLNTCAFMGTLAEAAPVVCQTPLSEGGKREVDEELSVTITETNTRTVTSGWSAGGSIEGNVEIERGGAKQGVSASGNYTYSRSEADSYSFATTMTYKRGIEIPEGCWGSGQLRLTGGIYGGLLLVYYPTEMLRSAGSTPPEGILREMEVPWKDFNLVPVLEVYPIRISVKAPGSDLPSLTASTWVVDSKGGSSSY